MSVLSTFATRFKELRESAGLKQSEIGEELGVSRGAISFYEHCDRTPDIEFASRAARFFHVSADWLLGLSDYQDAKTANLTVEDMKLSERATNALIDLAQSNDLISMNKLSALNLMLETDQIDDIGTQLLRHIADYLSAPEVSSQIIQFAHNGVKILDLDSDSAKNPPHNCISATRLYDNALIDQIILALGEIRKGFNLSQSEHDVQKEEAENGKPQEND